MIRNQVNGKAVLREMQNDLLVPELWGNLFSVVTKYDETFQFYAYIVRCIIKTDF